MQAKRFINDNPGCDRGIGNPVIEVIKYLLKPGAVHTATNPVVYVNALTF